MFLRWLKMVVGGCRWLWVVVGGFRSFLVLVLTWNTNGITAATNHRVITTFYDDLVIS